MFENITEEQLNKLNESIETEPDKRIAYYFRSMAYYSLNDYDNALKDINKAIGLDSNETKSYRKNGGKFHVLRGDIYLEMESYDLASENYDIGFKFNDISYQNLKNIDKAIAFYPNNENFHFRRGDIYLKMKNYDLAFENYDMAVKIAPDKASVYSNRSYRYSTRKDYANTLKDISKAIELDPNNKNFYYRRGKIYLEMENYDLALENYDKAIKLDEASPDGDSFFSTFVDRGEIHLERVDIYLEIKDYANALKDISKVIEFEPSDYYYSKRSDIYLKMKDYANALKDISKAIELDSNYPDFYFQRCDIYLKIKDYANALKDISKVIELRPEDLDLYVLRGNIYFEMKNWEEAANNLKKIKDIDDKSSCYYLLGDLKLSTFDIFTKLGRCYQKMKNYDEAMDALKYSIIYDEDFDIDSTLSEFVKEKEAQDRIDERNRIIADLSHSIKNLISTVIDPLESMKKEHAEENPVIENALKGANLIREIVNAMNLSFKGSIDDFYYDAKHNTGKDSLCLGDIITQSLIYSIGHMFDAKYFANFLRKYFPERSIFQDAKAVWQEKSQVKNIEELLPFIRQYFFDMQLNIADTAELRMGNEKGSAIKLLILLQEIIFNAVKYSAFVEKDRRFLHINLKSEENQIVITVENRYKKTVKTKTSGLGLVIIKNFASLLKNEPVIHKDEEIYSVTIHFANFWKEKSE